jgi:hypothetical protein
MFFKPAYDVLLRSKSRVLGGAIGLQSSGTKRSMEDICQTTLMPHCSTLEVRELKSLRLGPSIIAGPSPRQELSQLAQRPYVYFNLQIVLPYVNCGFDLPANDISESEKVS